MMVNTDHKGICGGNKLANGISTRLTFVNWISNEICFPLILGTWYISYFFGYISLNMNIMRLTSTHHFWHTNTKISQQCPPIYI
jgi:hypothetical protein